MMDFGPETTTLIVLSGDFHACTLIDYPFRHFMVDA